MNPTESSGREGAGGRPAPIAPHLARLERRLAEAFDELWGSFVEPEDAFFDADGLRWTGIGGLGIWNGPAGIVINEQQLAEIRTQCRVLAATNEFAINGHENRISYIVGSGHSYRAVAAQAGVPDSLVQDVQAVLDEFVEVNQWHKRQQEIVRRKDRDGECFLRLFAAPDGSTRVRFVEPGQVTTPGQREGDPAAAMGIQTEPDDVETVLGYWIDGRLVPQREIQHRKANVDLNVRRGLPLFFPVRKNLQRADKLLRNMSAVAQIQSSIALIRKHQVATGAALDQFVRDQADVNVTNQATGRTSYLHRYGPGTILDTAAGTDYEFPAAGLDAARYVTVLQAELRAIASRLVMPEFMLTSDASNANYASTMVAEGPAVKMFERVQNETMEDDLDLLNRVLANAVDAGRIASEALDAVTVSAVAPTLAARDRLRDAQADQILVRSGAMSPETMAMRHGLSPDHERRMTAKRPPVREAFNPDEPRDWRGRWTTGGADAGGSKPGGSKPGGSDVGVGYFDVAPELPDDSPAAGPPPAGGKPNAAGSRPPEAAKKAVDKEKAGDDTAANTDPQGQMSRAAQDLQKALSGVLDRLKQIAKDTGKTERGGLIGQAKDPNTKPQQKAVEERGKGNHDEKGNFIPAYWGENKEVMPKPNSGNAGTVDTDRPVSPDPDYARVGTFHTHPAGADGWPKPTQEDADAAHKDNVPDVMVHHDPDNNRYDIWITDTDGETYEYTPPKRSEDGG